MAGKLPNFNSPCLKTLIGPSSWAKNYPNNMTVLSEALGQFDSETDCTVDGMN